MMIIKATAMTVRQRLGELLNEVQYRRGRIIITKAGKPVAALVDVETFERIRNLDEEFDRLREEIAVSFSGQSEDEINAWIDEAVTTARTRPTDA